MGWGVHTGSAPKINNRVKGAQIALSAAGFFPAGRHVYLYFLRHLPLPPPVQWLVQTQVCLPRTLTDRYAYRKDKTADREGCGVVQAGRAALGD